MTSSGTGKLLASRNDTHHRAAANQHGLQKPRGPRLRFNRLLGAITVDDTTSVAPPGVEALERVRSCSEKLAGLTIDRAKFQFIKYCSDCSDGTIATANMKSNAFAKFRTAHAHFDRPVITIDDSPRRIGEIGLRNDLSYLRDQLRPISNRLRLEVVRDLLDGGRTLREILSDDVPTHVAPNVELTGRRRDGTLAVRPMVNQGGRTARVPCHWRSG